MADPLSLIGAVGAVANIIDLVTKIIDGVREVRGRWKEADLALLNLASQLTALRAALNKIQSWATNDLNQDSDYQMLMDLDMSINCCSLLVEKFDSFLSDIKGGEETSLNFSKKLKLVVGIKDLEGVQKMVEGQVSALTLLLTAFNCNSISEQKALLQSPKSRGIIGRVETDTASLIVHRDSFSSISNWTDNLSRFSVCFDFDRELFVTRVYEKVFRISIKEALKRRMIFMQHPDRISLRDATLRDSPDTMYHKRRSEMIDRQLKRDRSTIRNEYRSLIIGDETSGKEQILNHMRYINQGGYATAERKRLGPDIHGTVVECILFLLEAMKGAEVLPKLDANMHHYDFLLDYVSNRKPDEPLESDVGNAIHSLWNDPCTQKIFHQSSDIHSVDRVTYYFSHIHRITAPGYIPSDADIQQARIKIKGIYTTQVTQGHLTYRFSAVDLQTFDHPKWLHHFDDVTSLIFAIDLSCYDQASIENLSRNRMEENMVFFDHVIHLHYFKWTPIIILFNHISTFKRKLSTSPIGDHFPEFTGGNNFHDATQFLRKSFIQLNRNARRDMYCHFKDLDDVSVLPSVTASLKDAYISRNFRILRG